MPGAVPVTSAHALNNATLHYGLQLADKGLKAMPRIGICVPASTFIADASPTRRWPKRSVMMPLRPRRC